MIDVNVVNNQSCVLVAFIIIIDLFAKMFNTFNKIICIVVLYFNISIFFAQFVIDIKQYC